ncbi:hypothetical protein TSOC_004460 [Tetrabaena socialis]|uniref:Uncharacterized protein n=1 Tax=Tetrabaena socialis TaxID=47790 RepID=A0A2J8A8U2_9CHLO|nr:hypothetical protein TSOC_004460 [Tetrabaena socialis]|eukprot:PNH08938.1 hypothetical protein TSOC_004460 [Tetrabaena socialis]
MVRTPERADKTGVATGARAGRAADGRGQGPHTSLPNPMHRRRSYHNLRAPAVAAPPSAAAFAAAAAAAAMAAGEGPTCRGSCFRWRCLRRV